MFTLKATYDGYSGQDLWVSFSADNYVILYPTSEVHMDHLPNEHLQAPADCFPGAMNPKELALWGDSASWRDWSFNMQGNPVRFTDDGQIELLDDPQVRRLCVRDGNDREVYWSNGANEPSVHYLKFTQVPFIR